MRVTIQQGEVERQILYSTVLLSTTGGFWRHCPEKTSKTEAATEKRFELHTTVYAPRSLRACACQPTLGYIICS